MMPGDQEMKSHHTLGSKLETCLGSIPETKPQEARTNHTDPGQRRPETLIK